MLTAILRLCFLFSVVILAAGGQAFGADSIEELWKEARRDGQYVAPSEQDLTVAEDLFCRLLQKINPLATEDQWRRLGFELKKISFQDKSFILLHEKSTFKQGRGFYLFSMDEKNEHLLMIPHGFKDVGTDKIGLQLFKNHHFGAIAFNTVPRYHQERDGQRQEHDFGKLEDSFFVALSRAFATAKPAEKVVQLHGFSQEKRSTTAGADAAVILSCGTKKMRNDIFVLQNCLQDVLGPNILVYPRDVKELGGTTNITGKILRKSGHQGFVHVEINRPIRDRLRRESLLRQSFGNCLEKP